MKKKPKKIKIKIKKQSFFFVSAGGLEKRIFSRETLLLRGGRKGDPDTKSGLGTKTRRSTSTSTSTFFVNRSADSTFFVNRSQVCVPSQLIARSAKKIFCILPQNFDFQKVCVPPWRFRKILEFSTYCIFLLKFANFKKKTAKKQQKNGVFFSFPLAVWKSKFSVGRPFCSGAGEKETQTLKVVWELTHIARSAKKIFCILLKIFYFRKVCVPPWRFRKILEIPTYYIFIIEFRKNEKKNKKKIEKKQKKNRKKTENFRRFRWGSRKTNFQQGNPFAQGREKRRPRH